MRRLIELEFSGSHVLLEYDDKDPDVLPFVNINTDSGSEWYTATELHKLAEKLDVWQTMNMRGGSA